MSESVFKRTFKGYDPDQVDEFIIELSDTYARNEEELTDKLRALEAENARLKAEIAKLRDAAERREREHNAELVETQKQTDALCTEIGEKMITADNRAAEIIKNAEKEAALIITEARRSSENEAKAIRERAEAEASVFIEETKRKCESISAAAEEFRARQNEMNRSLAASEDQVTSALNKLREGLGDGLDNSQSGDGSETVQE